MSDESSKVSEIEDEVTSYVDLWKEIIDDLKASAPALRDAANISRALSKANDNYWLYDYDFERNYNIIDRGPFAWLGDDPSVPKPLEPISAGLSALQAVGGGIEAWDGISGMRNSEMGTSDWWKSALEAASGLGNAGAGGAGIINALTTGPYVMSPE